MVSLLGIDIGTASIKAVQLEAKESGRFVLQAIGKVETPPKSLESEAEADKRAVAEAIKALLNESGVKTKDVVASLPDAKIFTRLIALPSLTEEELASSIQWEADQYIPVPLEKVQLHWQIIERQDLHGGGKMEVLVVAAPKHLINQYRETLERCDLNVRALETEAQALSRSLVGQDPKPPTSIIVSLGNHSTDLSIVREGKLVLTRSIATASDALTRAVVERLGFDRGQAEAYKDAYGILKDKLGGKLADALIPVIDIIVNEIKRAVAFYLEQRPSDPIRRVILSGGMTKLPGLVVYFAENLGYEVVVGDPWSKTDIAQSIADEVKKEAAEYAIAAGLAMRKLK
jgi:type IV pilus assembly protein PilM